MRSRCAVRTLSSVTDMAKLASTGGVAGAARSEGVSSGIGREQLRTGGPGRLRRRSRTCPATVVARDPQSGQYFVEGALITGIRERGLLVAQAAVRCGLTHTGLVPIRSAEQARR